jgi:hypothetical protein
MSLPPISLSLFKGEVGEGSFVWKSLIIFYPFAIKQTHP